MTVFEDLARAGALKAISILMARSQRFDSMECPQSLFGRVFSRRYEVSLLFREVATVAHQQRFCVFVFVFDNERCLPNDRSGR